MKQSNVQVIILAAGRGKRMQSTLPKVLHTIGGVPLIKHILNTANSISANPPIVVCGHQKELIQKKLQDENIIWVAQDQQLGSAHAVKMALPKLREKHLVLILNGDVPLITDLTLQKLVSVATSDTISLLTGILKKPKGYGRIIRDESDKIIQIIEEKDASVKEKEIKEINAGIYCLSTEILRKFLPLISNKNQQHEYYLTDIIKIALNHDIVIQTILSKKTYEFSGVNDKSQLAQLERYYQKNKAQELMQQGVTIIDPARVDFRGDIDIASDVTIDINTILENVVIDSYSSIGANSIVRDSRLGKNVVVKENCIIEESEIGDLCSIGPFARIRPHTSLALGVKVGNFVEIKKSDIGKETKINHLTYVGDSKIGTGVNIGAGTITCNYDGVNKHQTTIEDYASIGANSSLVAPVTIREGSLIGAGSVITQDTPAHELTLSRPPQISKKLKRIRKK